MKGPVARKAIRHLKSNAPEWLTRVTVREGPRLRHRFWQPGGGYDRNITSTEALRAVIDYLHANPVRRGLVARAADWEWSSARWYAGQRPVKLEMDHGVSRSWQGDEMAVASARPSEYPQVLPHPNSRMSRKPRAVSLVIRAL